MRLALKVIRVVIQVVLALLALSLVMAVARPETGPLEKVVLVGAVIGLIGLAIPVGRIASQA